MSIPLNPPADFDGPWKATVELYLRELLAFCFPAIHDGIDWSAGYEWRDKDLQQAIPDSERASQTVDALVQVWRRDGAAAIVLLHLEVQSQYDPCFRQRMFRYYARLYDRYTVPIVSLAILGDESPSWQPSEFDQALWGVRSRVSLANLQTGAARSGGAGARRQPLRAGGTRAPPGARDAP